VTAYTNGTTGQNGNIRDMWQVQPVE